MSVRALLIDDDLRMAELLRDYLGTHGITLSHASDGQKGLHKVEQGFDIVLLDLTMPGMDGLEVCRRMRAEEQRPDRDADGARRRDRSRGRARARRRRLLCPSPSARASCSRACARSCAARRRSAAASAFAVGDLAIDVGRARRARRRASRVELTALEFDLLLALARRAGRVVAREALFSAGGRGDTDVSDRTVDVHISHLRAKLGDDSRAPKRIRTVRGVGYVLVKDDDA